MPSFPSPNSRIVTYVLVVGAIFQLAGETKALGWVQSKNRVQSHKFHMKKKKRICLCALNEFKSEIVNVNTWQLVGIVLRQSVVYVISWCYQNYWWLLNEKQDHRKEPLSGFKWKLEDKLNLQIEIILLTMSHVLFLTALSRENNNISVKPLMEEIYLISLFAVWCVVINKWCHKWHKVSHNEWLPEKNRFPTRNEVLTAVFSFDNNEQSGNSSNWKCPTDVSIVTQHNGLTAKNTGSYQYQGKRNAWLFHGSIIRRNVRLARDLMRKKFADQKNVARYFLLPTSRKSTLNRGSPISAPFLPLSSSLFFYVFFFFLFCFAAPDARCSLRIIKVVPNLDWRELRIHSLVSARGNWCSQLEKLRRAL